VPVLPIYTCDQPVLRKKAKPIRQGSDALAAFAGDMLKTMHNANGIGLAANQVGVLQRVIVVDLSGTEYAPADARPLALINPAIIATDGEWSLEEGCLSIPEIRDDVVRPEWIRVKYHDVDFKEQELEAKGMLGRVLQHEIDHLDGVLFIDHLNIVKRKLLRGRLNKIRRGEVEVTYPIVNGGAGAVSDHPLVR
jgi:peptide deformylase